MTNATVTYNFVNGQVADADQVNQNFSDITSIINSHLLHKDANAISDGSWIANSAGVVKVASATQNGIKIVCGKVPYSLDGVSTTLTINYGVTFTTILGVFLQVKASSNFRINATINGNPGLASTGALVYSNGENSLTHSGDLYWLAIGII